MQRREGAYLQATHYALSLLALIFAFPLLHFCFEFFFLASSFFQIEEKKKNTKKKKTIEKKKNAEKGGSLPSSFHSTISILAPASTFLLLPFQFKRFLLASSSSSQTEGKKNHKEKKTIKKKKNAKKGGNLSFFSCFCIWDEALLLLSPLHIPLMLSFPPSSSLVSTSPRSSVLLKIGSPPELWRWNEREMK